MFRKTCSQTLQLCKWGERGQETKLLKVFDYLVHQLNKKFSFTGSYHTHVGPKSGAHLFFYSTANMAPPTCSLCGSLNLGCLSSGLQRTWAAERDIQWGWKVGLAYWRLCQSCRRTVRAPCVQVWWCSGCSGWGWLWWLRWWCVVLGCGGGQKQFPEETTMTPPEDSVGPEVVPRRNYQDSSRRLGWAPSGHQKKLPWRYLFQRIALGPKQFPEETTVTLQEDRVWPPVITRRSYCGDISSRGSLWARSSSQKKLP